MGRTKDFDENEVLKKAVCLFWHKGYNGTSMQDLVDELEISRSSLYDTYGDKHALFIKALENYQQAGSNLMRDVVCGAESARDAIKQLLDLTTRELIADEQQKGCFLINAAVEVAPHDKDVKSIIDNNDQQIEDFFFDAIKKGQHNGEISSEKDARALARFIFNNVKGMRVSAKSTVTKSVFDDIIKLTMSALD